MVNKIMRSPYAVVAVGSLAIVLVMLFVGGGIAGSYALTVHYVQSLEVQQAATRRQSYAAICSAVHQMDSAGYRATFANTAASAYGKRLSIAIHQLYLSLNCGSVPNHPG